MLIEREIMLRWVLGFGKEAKDYICYGDYGGLDIGDIGGLEGNNQPYIPPKFLFHNLNPTKKYLPSNPILGLLRD